VAKLNKSRGIYGQWGQLFGFFRYGIQFWRGFDVICGDLMGFGGSNLKSKRNRKITLGIFGHVNGNKYLNKILFG
jgi:hypothetical protein